MTILRSGSNKKYSENWAAAFGKKKSKTTKSSAKKTTAKKAKAKKKSTRK